jgi:hypothetical protein
VRLKFWENGYHFQRQKVAVDLSHHQNLALSDQTLRGL